MPCDRCLKIQDRFCLGCPEASAGERAGRQLFFLFVCGVDLRPANPERTAEVSDTLGDLAEELTFVGEMPKIHVPEGMTPEQLRKALEAGPFNGWHRHVSAASLLPDSSPATTYPASWIRQPRRWR